MESKMSSFDLRALSIAHFLAIFIGFTGLGLFNGVAIAQENPKEIKRNLLDIDPENFDDNSIIIDNEWWPLKPGTRWIYEGHTIQDGKKVHHRLIDTITDLTKVINGVRVLVSQEDDISDGEMIEHSLAFHAQDKDGNVWHLGQLREDYDGEIFVGGRAWFVDYPTGAKAGIRMLANPRVGAPDYSQGFAPSPFHWTDRARVIKMGLEDKVPFGQYRNVMMIEEWDEETPAGVFQTKSYAKGVGVIRMGFRGPDPEKEELELVKMEHMSPEELAKARDIALGIEARAYYYKHTPPAVRVDPHTMKGR